MRRTFLILSIFAITVICFESSYGMEIKTVDKEDVLKSPATTTVEKIEKALENKKKSEEIADVIAEDLLSFAGTIKNDEDKEKKLVLFLTEIATQIYNQYTKRISLFSICSYVIGSEHRHAQIVAVLLSASSKIDNKTLEKVKDLKELIGFTNCIYSKFGEKDYTIPAKLTEKQVFSEEFINKLTTEIAEVFKVQRKLFEKVMIPFSRNYMYDLGDVLTSAQAYAQQIMNLDEEKIKETKIKGAEIESNFEGSKKKFVVLDVLKEDTGIKAVALKKLKDSSKSKTIYIVLIKTHESFQKLVGKTVEKVKEVKDYKVDMSLSDIFSTFNIPKYFFNIPKYCKNVSKYTNEANKGTSQRIEFIKSIFASYVEDKDKVIILGSGNGGGYVQSAIYHLSKEMGFTDYKKQQIEAHTIQSIGEAYYECWSGTVPKLKINITNHLWVPQGTFIKQGKFKHIGNTIYYKPKEDQEFPTDPSTFFTSIKEENLNPYAYNNKPNAYFSEDSDLIEEGTSKEEKKEENKKDLDFIEIEEKTSEKKEENKNDENIDNE